MLTHTAIKQRHACTYWHRTVTRATHMLPHDSDMLAYTGIGQWHVQHTYYHRTAACTCSHTAIKNRNAHTHRSCTAIQHTLTLVWDMHRTLAHCQTYAMLNMQLKTKQAAHTVLHRSQTGSTPTHTLLQHTVQESICTHQPPLASMIRTSIRGCKHLLELTYSKDHVFNFF